MKSWQHLVVWTTSDLRHHRAEKPFTLHRSDLQQQVFIRVQTAKPSLNDRLDLAGTLTVKLRGWATRRLPARCWAKRPGRLKAREVVIKNEWLSTCSLDQLIDLLRRGVQPGADRNVFRDGWLREPREPDLTQLTARIELADKVRCGVIPGKFLASAHEHDPDRSLNDELAQTGEDSTRAGIQLMRFLHDYDDRRASLEGCQYPVADGAGMQARTLCRRRRYGALHHDRTRLEWGPSWDCLEQRGSSLASSPQPAPGSSPVDLDEQIEEGSVGIRLTNVWMTENFDEPGRGTSAGCPAARGTVP
jgi:hypothetical protein